MPAGIEAIGQYIPPGRLNVSELRHHWPSVAAPGGVRSVSVAGFDEDIITMGVEAAEVVFASVVVDRESIGLLVVATCSSPYGEHSAAAEIARALGLPATTQFIDLAGSTLSGVAALQLAAQAVDIKGATRALVIASERRRGAPGTVVEALGAGAIALLVTRDAPASIADHASFRHGVPTRWRSADSQVLRNYDDARYELVGQVEPAVAAVLGALSNVTSLAVGPLDVRSRAAICKTVKLERSVETFDFSVTGDLGCAGPLFDLAGLLSTQRGESVACVAVEPGSGATGLRLEIRGDVPVADFRREPTLIDYVEFLQRFGALESPPSPAPIVPYAASPGAARSDLEGSLIGDRCTACGSLNVPPRKYCVDCGSREFARERLTRFGTVVTFNVQHVVAIAPEPSPVAVGVIRLRGEDSPRGGQVSAMFSDSDLAALSIGQEVELVYRRIGLDDGLVKYGWKVRTVVLPTEEVAS
jgi:hydroxymethylglutaryl-CoA synthase